MRKEIEIWMTPKQASETDGWKGTVAHILRVKAHQVKFLQPLQRSIDARSKNVKVRIKFEVYLDEIPQEIPKIRRPDYKGVSGKKPVIVVGAGPAGLFASLRLIELGLKPVILERGKDVRARKYDISQLTREHIVNPDSNYCFGEGGAGTYSDGKLYTRSTKRGNVREILELLIAHGASEEILIDSHAHIGTDKLPAIIAAIRDTILNAGGEIYFNRRIEDLLIVNNRIRGVVDKNKNIYEADDVLLATGHSARDIYELLHRKGILLEAKGFALGVRVEHPQQLIDSLQYHSPERGPYLPAAAYSFVKQVDGRGVFSFCMCPGGTIVPASTQPGQVVVNGMSNSRRNSPFANSGIVVTVEPGDFAELLDEYGPMAGIEFQRRIEEACWTAAGKKQMAPAQRLTDFIKGEMSSSFPMVSYIPGIISAPLHEILPGFVTSRLQEGFRMFDVQMKGFLSEEAVILGTESRTSSPVRIPRDKDTLESVSLKGLYPCGEGAGYSGGIVSSALDGVLCATTLASKYKKVN